MVSKVGKLPLLWMDRVCNVAKSNTALPLLLFDLEPQAVCQPLKSPHMMWVEPRVVCRKKSSLLRTRCSSVLGSIYTEMKYTALPEELALMMQMLESECSEMPMALKALLLSRMSDLIGRDVEN